MPVARIELESFSSSLKREERTPGTIGKYLRDSGEFASWLGERELAKDTAAGWREHLLEAGYAPAIINSMLSAVNCLLKFLGREDCRIRFLRVQRKTFREQNRELMRAEYQRLLDTAAEHGQERLGLLMETICATGIRVSEVQYITVEVRAERAGGDQPERQNPHHPPPVQALPEAVEIRPEAENRLRRDFSHQKRKAGLPPPDLAGDENAVRQSRCGKLKSFSTQPPASVCHGLLSGLPGYREAGGYPGALLHQHHTDLSHDHRRGTCAAAGEAGTCDVVSSC